MSGGKIVQNIVPWENKRWGLNSEVRLFLTAVDVVRERCGT